MCIRDRAKPTQYYVDKGTSDINLVVWSTPDSAQTYTLFYDYIKRIEDAGTNADANPDVPARYLPCLTYALALNVAMKYPEANPKVPLLKQRYDELWREVSESDRERASVRFVPDLGVY